MGAADRSRGVFISTFLPNSPDGSVSQSVAMNEVPSVKTADEEIMGPTIKNKAKVACNFCFDSKIRVATYPPSQLTPSAAHAVSLSQAGHKKKRCWKDAGGIGASLTRLCRRLWRRQSHRRLPGPISVQLQHAGSGDPQHLRYVLVCSCSTGAADGAWALWEGERTLGVEPPPPPHPPSRAHVCVL